jgi:hypothetical protein
MGGNGGTDCGTGELGAWPRWRRTQEEQSEEEGEQSWREHEDEVSFGLHLSATSGGQGGKGRGGAALETRPDAVPDPTVCTPQRRGHRPSAS